MNYTSFADWVYVLVSRSKFFPPAQTVAQLGKFNSIIKFMSLWGCFSPENPDPESVPVRVGSPNYKELADFKALGVCPRIS